jgi:hypothetical protein
MAAYTEEAEQGGGLVPLFIGRDDGTVERYDAMQDAELGIPTVAFYAHRRPVTGIVVTSPADLQTCSLDGTMKQWTLAEAPSTSVHDGGARVRASLVKTTTFPFGISVMVQDNGNRLLLGGEDGSLTLMEGERRSTWHAHDGGAVTAIAVDAEGSSAVLTGGTDGAIYVWDMEFGRPVCELREHVGPIRGLSFVPIPAAVPVVRQKRSADAAEVKEVLVHGNAEEGGSATAVLSCSQDGTVKVWLLPDLHDANAEAELLERQQQLQQELENAVGGQRRSIGICFQEPTAKAADAAGAEDHYGNEPPPPTTTAAAADGDDDADEANKDGQHAALARGAAPAAEAEADGEVETVAGASVPALDAKEQFLRQQVNAPAFKSAIKVPERRLVPHHAALGTVELPQTPFSCATSSSSLSSGGGGGGDSDDLSGPSLLFIGAAHGDVYGLRTRRLVKEVCLQSAYNFQKVQQEVSLVQKTLKDGTRVYAKAAAVKIKAEESTQLAIAAKARRTKAAEERAARKKEAEERRASRRRAAEEADEEGEEGEEEEEAENPFDKDDDEDAAEEAEEAEEESTEDAEDPANPRQPRRPASWKKLTEEQRAALEEFCAAQEAERDRKVAALRAAVEAHIAQVQPLAKTVYHRSGAQFANLSHTTSGYIHGGTAVTAMAAASSVAGYADKVYAAQVNIVVPVTVAMGLVKL